MQNLNRNEPLESDSQLAMFKQIPPFISSNINFKIDILLAKIIWLVNMKCLKEALENMAAIQ
jgi:hypothetical protein